MGTDIKHPVPYWVKPSFVIFDIRALWRSVLSVRVPGCQKLQDCLTHIVWFRMLSQKYGVNGLKAGKPVIIVVLHCDMHGANSAIVRCLSVCQIRHDPVLCQNGLTYRRNSFTHDRHNILVSCESDLVPKCRRGHR